MKEAWKTIEGFEDYQISNYGRVKSYKFGKIRLLKFKIDKDKYFHIGLYKSNKQKFFRISRLVAQAFIPNFDNKPEVNHKDGNKQNNLVTNLEWVTCSENIIHSIQTGLKDTKYNQGEKHYLSKLNEIDIFAIHGLYLFGMTQKEIGLLYNVTIANISLIINGKRWNHLLKR